MFDFSVNYLAVLVVGVLNMALGAFWYSPAAFGKIWMAAMGFTPESIEAEKKAMGSKYALGFLGSLVLSFVLALMVGALGDGTFAGGAQVGFWIWLGFIAVSSLSAVLWEGKKPVIYYIYNSYMLLSLLIFGGMLAVWV